MSEISKIDENLKVTMNLPDDVVFYDCLDAPCEVKGLCLEKENPFYRLPRRFENEDGVNDGVKVLLKDSAGGRIKFATDSPYVCAFVELSKVTSMPHMPLTGISGVDVYSCEMGKKDYTYKKTFMPKGAVLDEDKFYSGICEFNAYDDYEKREVLINLPLYNGVSSVKIGIKKGYSLFAPVKEKYTDPVYFYGSSITQGGCASRPGNTYMGYLSRALDFDFVNLGFSGSARGEQKLAEYIAEQKMSAFVLDYDANAPTVEHLKETHYPFYKTIREKNKDLPIIMLSFPKYNKRNAFHYFGAAAISRDLILAENIIAETYLRGIKEGDKNLYYISGETVFGYEDQDFCTVDNCHPNDHGFYMMAKAVLPVLKKVLK